MLINIAEETLLEKDKPAILSQNAAEMLPHLIISCSLATFNFFFFFFAIMLCGCVSMSMWKLWKKSLYLSTHLDIERSKC